MFTLVLTEALAEFKDSTEQDEEIIMLKKERMQ